MQRTHLVATLSCALFMTGCSLYGGAPVYGAFYRVSSEDLHAAVTAMQRVHHEPKIYALRVISANEVWLYYTPDEDGSYLAARRAKGRWEDAGGAIVISEPIRFNGHE